MSALPSVSVIIPTYNYGSFLADALHCALGQTLPPREIIVVDDGSTDDTPRIVENVRRVEAGGRNRAPIQYLRQDNAGPSAARNRGIRAASGEWVAFLDADDLWVSTKLALQMKCAVAYPNVTLIGGLNTCTPDRHPGRMWDMFSLLKVDDFLGGLPFGTSSAVARRGAVLAVGGFNEARRYCEDRELWLKLGLRAPAARVNTPVWKYRLHAGQSINSCTRMADNYRQVLNEFFERNPGFAHCRKAAYAYLEYDTALAQHEVEANAPALRHALRAMLAYPGRMSWPNAEAPFNRLALLLKTAFGRRGFELLNSVRRGLKKKPVAQPTPATRLSQVRG